LAPASTVVRRSVGPATASIEGLVLAGDISQLAQMVPFLLAGGLCRPPSLTFTTGG
jgi:hypothetical protein